jgi:hypothetical protein
VYDTGREDKAIRHPHRRAVGQSGGDDESSAKKTGAPYRIAPAWLGKIMRYCASTSTYYTNSRKRALYG